jgi:HSP20 family protein
LIHVKAPLFDAGNPSHHLPGRFSRGATSIDPGEKGMAQGFADPFDALFRFQMALDQQLESDWLEDMTSGVGAFPPINIFQKGSDFVAIVELPGVSKSDLNLEVRGNTIRISGKKTAGYGDKAGMHRRERTAGAFDRIITLPVQLDPDRIIAECRDGILALSLPRADSDKPKAIKVN